MAESSAGQHCCSQGLRVLRLDRAPAGGEVGRLAKARLPEGVAGVAGFHELVAELVDDPSDVVVGTETDRGLFIGALVAAGYPVIAVKPMSTSRYRERHSSSGAKSDPGDARALAEVVRIASPPTDSSASSTAASDTAPPMTNTPPGDTAKNKLLDDLQAWDV